MTTFRVATPPSSRLRSPTAALERMAEVPSAWRWITASALLLSLLAILAALPGCLVAAAGAGAGGVIYAQGDLESVEEAALDEAWSATVTAVEDDLDFRVYEKRKDGVSGELTARTATDEKVRIRLKPESATLTQISIRVDYFGDEAMSRAILERIQANLRP